MLQIPRSFNRKRPTRPKRRRPTRPNRKLIKAFEKYRDDEQTIIDLEETIKNECYELNGNGIYQIKDSINLTGLNKFDKSTVYLLNYKGQLFCTIDDTYVGNYPYLEPERDSECKVYDLAIKHRDPQEPQLFASLECAIAIVTEDNYNYLKTSNVFNNSVRKDMETWKSRQV